LLFFDFAQETSGFSKKAQKRKNQRPAITALIRYQCLFGVSIDGERREMVGHDSLAFRKGNVKSAKCGSERPRFS
jgi:hypothetical protein